MAERVPATLELVEVERRNLSVVTGGVNGFGLVRGKLAWVLGCAVGSCVRAVRVCDSEARKGALNITANEPFRVGV